MTKPRDRKMRPNARTKPTIRELGPRDPGPHGETVALRDEKPLPAPRLDRSVPSFMQIPTPAALNAQRAPKRTGRRGGQR